MTNTAIATAPSDESHVDRIIGSNVHMLMWRAQETQKSLSRVLRITEGALSHKVRGRRPWTAWEIDTVARHFRVTRDALFTKLPDLDSNQEPIGSQLAPVSQIELHRTAKLAAVSQLELHRTAKLAAHKAVHSDRDAANPKKGATA